MTDHHATPAPSSPANDSAAALCADLLEGIDLAPASHAAALALVTADAVARRDLVVHHPHRFWDQIAMIATRDAAIRALLSTEPQRTRFDATVTRWNRIRSGGSQ